MKKIFLIGFCCLILALCNCSAEKRSRDVPSANNQDNIKQAYALPEEYIDTHPLYYDIRTYERYDKTIITPIELFHRVYGKMPATLNEFFNSDFCFVHAKEKETGKLFEEAESLDVNHPEYLVYKYTDDDTAQLSFVLKTINGDPYIHTYLWNREKFWAFFPRDAYGRDEEEWKIREKTKPPTTTKKAKEMLDHFASMFYWAVVDYFDDHNSFPDSLDSLFEKWGVFRSEPWRNFQYDDPSRKLPNKVFGFDKARKALYVHSFWEDLETEYAMQLPANFIEEEGNPLNVREITDYKSLNIEVLADAETLINL